MTRKRLFNWIQIKRDPRVSHTEIQADINGLNYIVVLKDPLYWTHTSSKYLCEKKVDEICRRLNEGEILRR